MPLTGPGLKTRPELSDSAGRRNSGGPCVEGRLEFVQGYLPRLSDPIQSLPPRPDVVAILIGTTPAIKAVESDVTRPACHSGAVKGNDRARHPAYRCHVPPNK